MQHVSCVHTQILEVGHLGSGAATALIFYKGQLCAGYSDGSIKVKDLFKTECYAAIIFEKFRVTLHGHIFPNMTRMEEKLCHM